MKRPFLESAYLTPEAERLSKETAALRALANDAGVRGDWQVQIQAWWQIACIAPRLCRLSRDELLTPKFDDTIAVLAEAYAALLDDEQLNELWELVNAIPELRALHAGQVADAQARLPEYRRLYKRIEKNPGMDEPFGSAQLTRHAAKFGIITRTESVSGWTVTFHGVPIVDAERIEVSHLTDLIGRSEVSHRRDGWFERVVAWLPFGKH